MKANRLIVAISILVIIFGGVFLSQQLGLWQLKNSGGGRGSESEHVEEEESGEEAEYTEGELESTEFDEEHTDTDTEEDHESDELVSGSTTVGDMLAYGLTEEELVSVIGEYDDESQLIKDVATANGLSYGKIKDTLAGMVE